MITVQFTKEQINNLKIFLARTNMAGAEVQAYVEIIQTLQQAEEESPNDG